MASIRANTPVEFIEAFQRTTKLLHALLAATEANSQEYVSQYLLVEDYIPGIEVALEGILLAGELKTLRAL